MTEETGKKRVVGRNVAIALGLICLILAGGLAAVLSVYLSGGASSTELTQLRAENEGLRGNMTMLTSQIAALQASLAQAQNDLLAANATSEDYEYLLNYTSGLQNLLNLGASSTLINQAGPLNAGENVTYNELIEYAGYVTVQVTSSSNTTYAQVIFTYAGFTFNNTAVVGTSGTAAFPVLPGTVDIIVGNTEPATNPAVNMTVLIVYIY